MSCIPSGQLSLMLLFSLSRMQTEELHSGTTTDPQNSIEAETRKSHMKHRTNNWFSTISTFGICIVLKISCMQVLFLHGACEWTVIFEKCNQADRTRVPHRTWCPHPARGHQPFMSSVKVGLQMAPPKSVAWKRHVCPFWSEITFVWSESLSSHEIQCAIHIQWRQRSKEMFAFMISFVLVQCKCLLNKKVLPRNRKRCTARVLSAGGTPLSCPGLGQTGPGQEQAYPSPGGQTNKLKTLPSDRTMYAGGNNHTHFQARWLHFCLWIQLKLLFLPVKRTVVCYNK